MTWLITARPVWKLRTRTRGGRKLTTDFLADAMSDYKSANRKTGTYWNSPIAKSSRNRCKMALPLARSQSQRHRPVDTEGPRFDRCRY